MWLPLNYVSLIFNLVEIISKVMWARINFAQFIRKTVLEIVS